MNSFKHWHAKLFNRKDAIEKGNKLIQSGEIYCPLKNHVVKKSIVLLLAILVQISVFGEKNSETGYPFITNYFPKDYGAFQANWAISQDKRGIMYFGNDYGMLEFDGINWRLYQVPSKTTIRSIFNSNDGKIYVGAVGDLGYFEPDSSGELVFHSLKKFLPKNKRDFADVWGVLINDDKAYFNAMNYLFIWNIKKHEFKVIQRKNDFHLMFLVHGKIYVREWGVGLEVLQNDSLKLLDGGEKFADERIYVMLPFPGEKGTSLIVSRTMGMFKYDGHNFIPFKTEADQFIKENLIYSPGTVLSDGNILLETISGGAVVIDSTGKEVRNYNRKNGIISDGILYSYQDHSGAIWLATDNGISQIDYSSPISYFDSRNNFSTAPLNMIRHNGILYAAANNGIYYLDPKTSEFHTLKNSSNQSFSFLEWKNKLLAGTFDGVFEVDRDRLKPIRKTVGNEYITFTLKQSKSNPNRIFVGAQGLWSLLKTPEGWKDEGQILDLTDETTSVVQDNDGTIWCGTQANGAFHVIFKKNKNREITIKNPTIEHYAKESGLQEGYLTINKFNGKNYFTTPDSTYLFDENKKIFYSDTTDQIISSFYKTKKNESVTLFQKDSLGHLWLGTFNTLSMGTRQSDGSYKWLTAPFNRIARDQISRVYAEKNGVIWFLAGSALIRYDFLQKKQQETQYPALVRQVEVGRDSVIYFGGNIPNSPIPKISFKDNSIKFNFSATNYDGKNTNRFRTILDGFDNSWSAWSNENTKEYTNLPPGKYTFNVSAENIQGIKSTKGTFSFRILPPWYRTWAAYAGYLILFALLFVVVDRLQRRRLLAKERSRAELREAKLRAEAENDRRKNIELLSEIGKEITGSLSIEHIIATVYTHVNALMDASVFGIGILNKEKQLLEFPATKEKGETLPPYSYNLEDDTRPAIWCFRNKKEIFINDFEKEHQKYITQISEVAAGEYTESLIYLPLVYKDKSIGVVTAQSFSKSAYTNYHLNLLRSLATYAALALDNAEAYRELKSTQDSLIQSEKMASLGELTAGIAHEIQNPLNFVNNFSEVNQELIDELLDERDKTDRDSGLEKELLKDIKANEEKINHHGKRADAIVKNMLQHSRGTSGHKEFTDINNMADEYLRLSYHGLRAKDKSFNAEFKIQTDSSLPKIKVVPQDIGRVLLNLINNAFYAVSDRAKNGESEYKPTVWVITKSINGKIEISVKDNGIGIPETVREKIFQPFFTTKPTGQGTGLGLSLSFDIIKAHGGRLEVESKKATSGNQDFSTAFNIILPVDTTKKL